ncbi:MAG: hypothetical protein GYB31_07010 [Bacteroidetes bacterium]|nr:hypothetical protein [Bacteroidota bacterium]
MFRQLCCLILMLTTVPLLHACDVCGCVSSGASSGLLEYSRSNYARVQYQLVRFLQERPGDNISQDKQTQIQITTAFFLTEKIRASLYLPYQVNLRKRDSETLYDTHGIGDPSLFLGWVENIQLGENTSLSLEPSLGAGIPLGRHAEVMPDFDEIPVAFYPGRGVWSFKALQRINVNYKNLSWSSFAQLGLFQVADWGYESGNQWALGSFLRYVHKGEKVNWMPYFGGQWEIIRPDYYQNEAVHGTGGHSLVSSIGFDCNINRLLMGFALQLPVQQQIAGGEIRRKPGFNMHLSIIL